MTGCHLAQRLERRAQVTIFEKSSEASGRLSTHGAGDFTFDDGAQYFTARSEQFLEYLRPFLAQGLVQGWNPRLTTLGGPRPYKRQWFEPHFVAIPSMACWLKQIAASLQVHYQTKIVCALEQGGLWQLQDAQDKIHGPYDWVISTAPAPLTASLFPSLAARLSKVKMTPCFSWLLGFEPLPGSQSWEAAVVQNSPLSWLSWNQSRPGRSGPPALVAHSSNEWAEEHWGQGDAEVLALLAKALQVCSGIEAGQARFSQLQRWRYAATSIDLGVPFLADFQLALAAAGDWCLKGRLEGAFLSAHQLADYLLSA